MSWFSQNTSAKTSSYAATSVVERLNIHLQFLDSLLFAEAEDNMQLAAKEATRASTRLWFEINQIHMEALTSLVWTEEFARATDTVLNNFPGAVGSCSFCHLMELIMDKVYVDDGNGPQSRHFKAIEWLEHMDAEQQLVGFEVLYELIKSKGHTDKPQILLLLKSVNKVTTGVVRARVEADCFKAVTIIVAQIKIYHSQV